MIIVLQARPIYTVKQSAEAHAELNDCAEVYQRRDRLRRACYFLASTRLYLYEVGLREKQYLLGNVVHREVCTNNTNNSAHL